MRAFLRTPCLSFILVGFSSTRRTCATPQTAQILRRIRRALIPSRVSAATLTFGGEKQSHLRHRFYDLVKGGSAPIATQVLVYKTVPQAG